MVRIMTYLVIKEVFGKVQSQGKEREQLLAKLNRDVTDAMLAVLQGRLLSNVLVCKKILSKLW